MKYIIILLISLLPATDLSYIKLVNKSFSNCNQIIENNVFKSCYNYELKSATASLIEIKAEQVNTKNIAKRPAFYEDKSIPELYRTKSEDWTNTEHDRGHIQSDASNDYTEDVLRLTYAMSNITMQKPITNRKSYLEVEKRERELAVIHGKIKALTIINYSQESINTIRVPSEYIKIFFDSSYNTLECYKVKNDNQRYELNQLKIDCSLL